MSSLNAKLACSCCKEIVSMPILQCSNGHVIGSECYLAMSNGSHVPVCPFPGCMVDMHQLCRNKRLEAYAAKCVSRCKYECCNEKNIKLVDLAEHQEICDHRPVNCLQCGTQVENWSLLWDHCRQQHGTKRVDSPVWHLPPDSMEQLRNGTCSWIDWSPCSIHDGVGYNLTYPLLYYSVSQNSFFVSVREIGPLSGKSYQLTISCPKMDKSRLSLVLPATSYRNSIQDTNSETHLPISETMMGFMCDDFTQALRIKISPKHRVVYRSPSPRGVPKLYSTPRERRLLENTGRQRLLLGIVAVLLMLLGEFLLLGVFAFLIFLVPNVYAELW